MAINVSDYNYYYTSVYVPSIQANFNAITLSELEELLTQYDAEALQYKNELREIVLKKQYVLDRFKKDVLVEVGFATKDIEHNTYTENYYAQKYLNYAIGSLKMNTTRDFEAVITNLTSLYQLFLNKNDEPFSSEMKAVETYDTRAITVFDDIYILMPNTIGKKRVYKHGTDTVSFESNKWVLKDNTGTIIALCDDIDAAEPNWAFPEEESSSSENSSESSEESSESSETVEPETSSESSEEPVEEPEESSSSETEEPVVEESSSSETVEEPVVEESSSSETVEPEEPAEQEESSSSEEPNEP